MPVIIKDHKWRETESSVTLRVPLHGVPKKKVDLFISENYLKTSFEHFFFECFLYSEINVEESLCTIQEHCVLFELTKSEQQLWLKFEKENLSKEEKRGLRSEALESMQKKLQEEKEAKQSKEIALKREAVSLSIELSGRERDKISKIREEEKQKALGDIKDLVETIEIKSKPKSKDKMKQKVPKIEQLILKEETPAIPLPRSKSVVEVEFTPRAFPTPGRESQEAEENEWLARQAEARRSAGFVSEDLRLEEKNPHYLLAKAAEFLKNRNYLGAISALTFGIEISPKLVDFFILRSEAQFGIGNLHKCVQDCSTALEMMKPEVGANLNERIACIARRGMALNRLGLKRQAVDELHAALRLKPYDSMLKQTLEEIVASPEVEEKDHKGLEIVESNV